MFPAWYVQLAALVGAGRNSNQIPGCHAMLFSYFDDSSDDRRQKYFAAGGLIGGEDQWFTFDMRWLDATRELKEPFRSTDCECNHGQFKRWKKQKCNALMDKLVTVIRFHQLMGFASIVPITEYRQVFPDSEEFDPYYLAVTHTIINMATLGYNIRHGVKLWFEDSTVTSQSTLRIYQSLRGLKTWNAAFRLQNIDFGGKELCPLQAADLVAREAFKHIDNLGSRPTRIPTKRMHDSLSFIVWNRPTLEYLRDNGGPNNLELLTSWGLHGRTVPPMTVFYRNF